MNIESQKSPKTPKHRIAIVDIVKLNRQLVKAQIEVTLKHLNLKTDGGCLNVEISEYEDGNVFTNKMGLKNPPYNTVVLGDRISSIGPVALARQIRKSDEEAARVNGSSTKVFLSTVIPTSQQEPKIRNSADFSRIFVIPDERMSFFGEIRELLESVIVGNSKDPENDTNGAIN